MILHGGILALLTGSAIVFALVLLACTLGFRVLVRWDFTSNSEAQLALERRTYLVSTLVHYALGFEILSVLLFIHTLDDIHPLFVGAMCATGSLNANPVGWSALTVKLATLFAAGGWLALNHVDQRADDAPLVRPKYTALLLLTPLLGLGLYLQVSYFLGLKPEIITSCCGALFGTGEAGVASELAGLPPGPTMAAFYAGLALFAAAAGTCLVGRAAFWRYLLAATAAGNFAVSLAAVISFVSLYHYQLPTHHCPFDMLQGHYGHVGYPLYAGLSGGTLFGLLPGLFQPLKRIESLREPLQRAERAWLKLALLLMLGFALIASWPIVFGDLRLFS